MRALRAFAQPWVTFPCHNYVVERTEAENLACFGQLLVCLAVGLAGMRLSGGMVMHKDNSSGPVGNGVREDLARMNLAVVKQADRDDPLRDQFVRTV